MSTCPSSRVFDVGFVPNRFSTERCTLPIRRLRFEVVDPRRPPVASIFHCFSGFYLLFFFNFVLSIRRNLKPIVQEKYDPPNARDERNDGAPFVLPTCILISHHYYQFLVESVE